MPKIIAEGLLPARFFAVISPLYGGMQMLPFGKTVASKIKMPVLGLVLFMLIMMSGLSACGDEKWVEAKPVPGGLKCTVNEDWEYIEDFEGESYYQGRFQAKDGSKIIFFYVNSGNPEMITIDEDVRFFAENSGMNEITEEGSWSKENVEEGYYVSGLADGLRRTYTGFYSKFGGFFSVDYESAKEENSSNKITAEDYQRVCDSITLYETTETA